MQTQTFTHTANMIFDVPALLKSMGVQDTTGAFMDCLTNPYQWENEGHSKVYGGIRVTRKGDKVVGEYLN